MPNEIFLTYEASGIAGVLRTESLSVPGYQRSYAWNSLSDGSRSEGDDGHLHVVEFWEDLLSSYRSGNSYFLGTIVLSQEGAEDGRAQVLDGQQRLATTSILLHAIAAQYESKGESAISDSIFQDYVGTYDRDAEEIKPKIILNTEDRDYFDKKFLQKIESTSPTCQSQILIHGALSYLADQVQQFSNSAGARWKEELKAFTKFLDERAQVITIAVANDADAFLIFETLNDRGADLTIADLLKNYLFSKAAGRLDEVRTSWIRTLHNLDISKVGNVRFTLFVKHFMSARHGVVRERDLYRRIKSEVTDPNSAVAFAKDLESSSRLYFGLISSESDVWADYSPTTSAANDILLVLNLERYRPLLLAALQNFEASEVETLMTAMVSWSIRGLAAARFGGGVAEAAFCEVAKSISDGTITSTVDILSAERMSSMIPSDTEFEKAFSEWRVVKGSLARYILRTLELTERGDDQPELVVNSDTDKVNLEHILPKSANDGDWSSFGKDERASFVFRLGNMVLLQKGPNDRIGNKSWVVKQPVLAVSQLELTKKASKSKDWGKAEIIERQAYLATLAVKAWKR